MFRAGGPAGQMGKLGAPRGALPFLSEDAESETVDRAVLVQAVTFLSGRLKPRYSPEPWAAQKPGSGWVPGPQIPVQGVAPLVSDAPAQAASERPRPGGRVHWTSATLSHSFFVPKTAACTGPWPSGPACLEQRQRL